jgi:ESS family glutamate:Na+ symporter
MCLVNWAARKGYARHCRNPEEVMEDASIGVIPVGQRPEAGRLTVTTEAVDSLSIHLAFVGISCLFGYIILMAIQKAATLTGVETISKIFSSFPLFPMCMMGGLIVQLFEQKFDKNNIIDTGLIRRIQNTALDFLVVAAIATIRVERLYDGLAPFIIMMVLGVAWNVFCVTFLAKRLLPDAWFERSIAEMGQSMGVTATGLLLLRVVDPEFKTPAADSFAYKQILHEPFMGGGMWTSAAIPLLALWGGWPVFGISVGAVAAWFFVLLVIKPFGKNQKV